MQSGQKITSRREVGKGIEREEVAASDRERLLSIINGTSKASDQKGFAKIVERLGYPNVSKEIKAALGSGSVVSAVIAQMRRGRIKEAKVFLSAVCQDVKLFSCFSAPLQTEIDPIKLVFGYYERVLEQEKSRGELKTKDLEYEQKILAAKIARLISISLPDSSFGAQVKDELKDETYRALSDDVTLRLALRRTRGVSVNLDLKNNTLVVKCYDTKDAFLSLKTSSYTLSRIDQAGADHYVGIAFTALRPFDPKKLGRDIQLFTNDSKKLAYLLAAEENTAGLIDTLKQLELAKLHAEANRVSMQLFGGLKKHGLFAELREYGSFKVKSKGDSSRKKDDYERTFQVSDLTDQEIFSLLVKSVSEIHGHNRRDSNGQVEIYFKTDKPLKVDMKIGGAFRRVTEIWKYDASDKSLDDINYYNLQRMVTDELEATVPIFKAFLELADKG
jgi:hypothetical protein